MDAFGLWYSSSLRSIAERYSNRGEYLQLVGSAARRMVEGGYLLDRDVPALIEHSAAEWDYVNSK